MNPDKKQLEHLADCIMVDTLGLCVENVPDAKLPKAFAQVDDNPNVTADSEWSKGSVKAASGKQSFRVRAVKKTKDLMIEGSNAVHYQNHNVASSNDVTMSIFSILHAVKTAYPLGLDLWSPYKFVRGLGIEITRIDTPILLQKPIGLEVAQIINSLAIAGIAAGINISLYMDETVYYDQHAQNVALKAYDKAAEMQKQRRKQPLPDSPNTAALLDLAKTTIRFEPVYRKKYFQNHPLFKGKKVTPGMLIPAVLAIMFSELIEKYNLKGSLRQKIHREDLYAIRQPYRNTVANWQQGLNLLKMFNSNKNKLNAHQRVIKHEYSIDIFAPPPGEIDMPIELGEIIRVENFVTVPASIRADPVLFYQRDMYAEARQLSKQLELRGLSAAYIHPNDLDNEDWADSFMKF